MQTGNSQFGLKWVYFKNERSLECCEGVGGTFSARGKDLARFFTKGERWEVKQLQNREAQMKRISESTSTIKLKELSNSNDQDSQLISNRQV